MKETYSLFIYQILIMIGHENTEMLKEKVEDMTVASINTNIFYGINYAKMPFMY